MVRLQAVIAAALLVLPAAAWAQSEAAIRGRVTAAVDGSRLGGAAVTLTMPSAGVVLQRTSGADGEFAFLAVTPGEYLLTVSADGFARRELRVLIEPREARTIEVTLQIATVDVALEVIADRTASAGTHSPSSTTLTMARLDAMPIFQRVGLADAIVSSAPGMIRGHDDFVHIRGHEVALNPLINGVSFWENTHAVFSAGLSPDVIDTANVMTGGFPAEYGNRFGGVVDIVTRSGLRLQDRGALSVSAGGAGRWRAGGDVGGRRGAFGYFVFGSGFGSERFLSPPDREAIHDAARGGHVFAQLEGTGRFGLVRAVVMGDGTTLEIPRTPIDMVLRPLANARQDNRQQTAIVSWLAAWRDVSVSTSAYQRWSRVRLFPAEGPLTVHASVDRKLSTLGGKIDATRISGRHVLKTGIDAVRLAPRETLSYVYDGYLEFTHLVDRTHVHLSGPPLVFSGAGSGGQVSAYLQDNIQAGRVTVDAGVRVDHYGLLVSATHASPRANIGVRVSNGTMLHASYNHFFVPPPIEGVLSSSAGLTRLIDEIGVALEPLEPTVEDQFELGVTTAIGPMELALTSYYRDTANPVHTTLWPDSRIYSYASFERGRAYGLEMKLEMSPAVRGSLTGFLNYALGRVDFWNPVTGGFVTEAGHLTDTSVFRAPMDQTHTLTGGTTFTHAATGLWASGAIEYGSGTPMGHGVHAHDHAAGTAPHPHAIGPAERVPGHMTGGIAGGVNLWRSATRRPRLALQVDLENIANHVYVIAQEGEFAPTQYSNPRLLSVTVKFSY